MAALDAFCADYGFQQPVSLALLVIMLFVQWVPIAFMVLRNSRSGWLSACCQMGSIRNPSRVQLPVSGFTLTFEIMTDPMV